MPSPHEGVPGPSVATPSAAGTTRPTSAEPWSWSTVLRGPGGVVRIAGLVCVVVAFTVRGPIDAALFSMVLAGLFAPLLGGVRPWLDAAYGVGLLASAWSGVLDLYESVNGLDLVMHLVVTGLLAAVAHLVVARRTGAVVDPAVPAAPATRAGSVVVTTALGLTLSVAWEIGEYLGNTYLDPTIYVAYRDTIGDLIMGGAGSTVAGILLLRFARRAGGR